MFQFVQISAALAATKKFSHAMIPVLSSPLHAVTIYRCFSLYRSLQHWAATKKFSHAMIPFFSSPLHAVTIYRCFSLYRSLQHWAATKKFSHAMIPVLSSPLHAVTIYRCFSLYRSLQHWPQLKSSHMPWSPSSLLFACLSCVGTKLMFRVGQNQIYTIYVR